MSDSETKDETKPKVGRPKESAEVTYIPGDGDPHKVLWNGIEFRANVPVTLHRDRMVSVPLRKEHYLADGTLQSRGVEQKVSMIELARHNPSFSVDGVKTERLIGTARLPTDNDQYRGYALAWIRDATSVQQLDVRWDAESSLRERCGCDDKDMMFLRPFFDARRSEMKEAA